MIAVQCLGVVAGSVDVHGSSLDTAIVVTQLPVASAARSGRAGGMLRADFGDGARLVIVAPDQTMRVLVPGFAGAIDPNVSFDGRKIVFAGKKSASDDWNIYEIGVDGRGLRQITRDLGQCRSPVYMSTLYTIVSTEPWYQIAFTSTVAGEMNEVGPIPAVHLYTCRLDGTGVRRLSFNLSNDMDPFLMQDGRLLYAGWQRSTLDRGLSGRISLFTINGDGTDVSIFAADEGAKIKHMPATTVNGLAVFVEADEVPWDGAGRLARVALRRNLHSYQQITEPITEGADGLFHSPSPLPDGTILVSRRPSSHEGNHGVYRIDLETGKTEPIFDHPDYHDIQAQILEPRPEPDGRSSVVNEEDPNGHLYCLDVSVTDLEQPDWMAPGTVARMRVMEGIARSSSEADSCGAAAPPIVHKRILGDFPVEKDGSFYIKVPANTPIQIQAIDENGLALRTCSWIWTKNREPRGCIGCHEDPELTPENRLIDAVRNPPIDLTLPPERRRVVDFRRHVMPIISAKCALAGCHDGGENPLDLGGGLEPVAVDGGQPCFNRAYQNLLGRSGESEFPLSVANYVHPGQARNSPLIWALLGRNTSRPWDTPQPGVEMNMKPMPPTEAEPLTGDEIRTFVEWIDLGALSDRAPGDDGGKR